MSDIDIDIGIGCRVVHVKDHEFAGVITHIDRSIFGDCAVVVYDNGDRGYHRTTRLIPIEDGETDE